MKFYRKIFLCLTVVASLIEANAQFTQQQINGYRKSVVRVDARGCAGVPGGSLVGSGFLWKQSTWVVTALHVINGCTGLSVYSDTALDSSAAHVSKILLADDLVLLSLDKAIAGTGILLKVNDAPQDTQEMLIVGFPGDSSGSTGKTVKRQFSGATLDTIVSYNARQELQKSQSPALSTNVVFLQGTLEHGHSGSPIFNHDGGVVGIADGGLKHGTTEDSWAIPSQELTKLESSTDPISKMSNQRSSLLFAAVPSAGGGGSVQCGGGSFRHLKKLGYSEILTTADDPVGLQQLAAASPLDPREFAFEVYQDLGTGATVVLPEGVTLSADGKTCLGTTPGGGVSLRARLDDTTADPTGQTAALAFETEIMGLPRGGWVFAQAYSYLHPLPVLGGGFSLRKNWVHYLPLPNFPQQINYQQFDATQFETLAGRGHILLGVTALNSRWTPGVVQTQQSCLVNANISPYCTLALQDHKEWIESVLSIHLSTLAGT